MRTVRNVMRGRLKLNKRNLKKEIKQFVIKYGMLPDKLIVGSNLYEAAINTGAKIKIVVNEKLTTGPNSYYMSYEEYEPDKEEEVKDNIIYEEIL